METLDLLHTVFRRCDSRHLFKYSVQVRLRREGEPSRDLGERQIGGGEQQLCLVNLRLVDKIVQAGSCLLLELRGEVGAADAEGIGDLLAGELFCDVCVDVAVCAHGDAAICVVVPVLPDQAGIGF